MAIFDLHYQSVRVPLDVENYAVVPKKTGGCMAPFDVMAIHPFRTFDRLAPCIQRPSSVGMLLLEVVQLYEAKDLH